MIIRSVALCLLVCGFCWLAVNASMISAATTLRRFAIIYQAIAGVPERRKGKGGSFSKGTFNIVRTVISTNISLQCCQTIKHLNKVRVLNTSHKH